MSTLVCSNSTQPTLGDLRFVLIFAGGLPLIISGIVTSLLSFFMFRHDTFTPATTKLMLMTTALVDVAFLLSAVFFLEFKMFYTYFLEPGSALQRLYKNPIFYGIVYYVINCCEMFRNWLIVLIGIERYLVTCYPLHFKEWWSMTRTIFGIVGCGLLTLLLRIPILIRRVTLNIPARTRLSEATDQVHTTIDSIFLTVLPVVILTFCTIRIQHAMARSQQLRECSSSSDRVRITVNKVLTVVLTVFTLCGLPFVVFSVVKFLAKYTSMCWAQTLTTSFISICWFSSLLFSASNFYVYILHWSKYRDIICVMLGCRKRGDGAADIDSITLSTGLMNGSRANSMIRPRKPTSLRT